MDGEKNRFVHGLRNPLNTISVNAELGKLTLERTGDIHRAIAIFETILVECRQCNQLLETLKGTRFVRDESNGETQE